MQQSFNITVKSPDGSTAEHRVYRTPFHIGSRSDIDLVLDGEGIAESHVRLMARPDQTVFMVNLSTEVKLGGKAIEAYIPTQWSSGEILELGDYQLSLSQQTERADLSERKTRPEVPLPPEFVLSEAGDITPPEPLESPTKKDVPEAAPPVAKKQTESTSLWLEPRNKRPDIAERPTVAPAINLRDRGDTLPRETKGQNVAQVFARFSDQPGEWLENTLAKQWNDGQGLSVQPSHNPIRLASGEKTRFMLSVRNLTLEAFDCVMAIEAVRQDWELVYPETFHLEPGASVSFSVTLYVPEYFQPGQYNLPLSIISDQGLSKINLYLNVELKSAGNVKAWIEPDQKFPDRESYLLVQNMTRQMFSCGIQYMFNNPLLYVIGQPDSLTLEPGQTVTVKLILHAPDGEFFKTRSTPYWVTLTTPNRAPLQIDGVIFKPAGACMASTILWALLIMLIAGLLIGLGILTWLLLN